MSRLVQTFAAIGVSPDLTLAPGQSASYALSGTFSASLVLEISRNAGASYERHTGVFTTATNGSVPNETNGHIRLRWRCITYTSGSPRTVLADEINLVQEFRHPITNTPLMQLLDVGMRVPGAFDAPQLLYNVLAYGVIADGVTDVSETANEVIAMAPFGSTVFFPPGTYNFIAAALAGKSGIRILARGATFKLDPTGTKSIISAGDSNNIVEDFCIEGPTIDGQVQLRTPPHTGIAGIQSYAFRRLRIVDVTVKNTPGYGIGLQGTPNSISDFKRGPQEDLRMERVRLIYCGNGRAGTPTTLVGAISDSDTTFDVADASVLNATGGTLQIDDEVMRHGVPVGNTLTVIRGVVGTTPAAHSDGATVWRSGDADGIDIKSGYRVYMEDCVSENCGDKGFNPRARFLTMIRCHDNGSVVGINPNNIAPPDEVAAAVSTMLNGAVTNSATTFTVDSASTFPTSGTAFLDSEEFTYTGKTSTTLTGITRGTGGTVAIAHDDDTPVAYDSLDDSFDTVGTLIGCSSENNTLSGFSVASGSPSSTSEVNMIGCWVRKSGSGFNISGGSSGNGGGGRLRSKIIGGGAYDCTGAALVVQNAESFSVGGGWEARKNGDHAIHLLNQSNGCIINEVLLLANVGAAIVEQGTSNFTRIGMFIERDNAGGLSLIGANSTVLNTNVPFNGEQWYSQTSGSQAWTPGLIASGALSGWVSVTVPGAVAGAFVEVLFDVALPDGCWLVNHPVTGAVKVAIKNESGSDQTIAAGTLRVTAKRATTTV